MRHNRHNTIRAGAIAAVMALAGVAGPAQAVTYVTNAQQDPGNTRALANSRVAQGFKTGNVKARYGVSYIRGRITASTTGNGYDYSALTMKVFTSSGNAPGTEVFAGTLVGNVGDGFTTTFSVPTGSALDGNTWYYLVVDNGANTGEWDGTESPGEDMPEPGWEIANSSLYRSGGVWATEVHPRAMRVDGDPINAKPTGTSNTVRTSTNTRVTLTATQFGIADADPGDTLGIRIVSLESAGDLELDGNDVTANQTISKADIDAGKLTFTPGANENNDTATPSTHYATFTFKVNDGTADSDATYTMTVSIGAGPGAPQGFAATQIDQGVLLTWQAPMSDGGSAVTGYQYRYAEGETVPTSATWRDVPDSDRDGSRADERSVRARYLDNGKGYAFEIRAQNADGGGATAGPATATPAALPGAPKLAGVYPGPDYLFFKWYPPASDGGSAITRYEYRVSTTHPIPERVRWTRFAPAAHNEHVAWVRGLDAGVTYHVELRARNAQGPGDVVTGRATPSRPPSPPRNVRVSRPGPGGLTLAWDAPEYDGGMPIAGYRYRIQQGPRLLEGANATPYHSVGKDTRRVTVWSLENRALYSMEVEAFNDAEWVSEPSPKVQSFPNTPPTSRDGQVQTKAGETYTFKVSDFTFSDADGDAIESVWIDQVDQTVSIDSVHTLKGRWQVGGRSGSQANFQLALPKKLTKRQIEQGQLAYTPEAGASGSGYSWVRFRVGDGLDRSQPRTISIDIEEPREALQIGAELPDRTYRLRPPSDDPNSQRRTYVDFVIPADAFADNGPLTYTATLADGTSIGRDAVFGSPVPWLRFRANERRFWGYAPADADEDSPIHIRLSARNRAGLTAHQDFAISFLAHDATVPTVSIAAPTDAGGEPSAVDEGDPATFTVTLDRAAPAGGLTVHYRVSHAHSWAEYPNVAGTALGAHTLAIAAGATSAMLTVPTVETDVANLDTEVTVVIEAGNGYLRGEPKRASRPVSNTTTTRWTFRGNTGFEGASQEICYTTVREDVGTAILRPGVDKASEWTVVSSIVIDATNISRSDDIVEAAGARVRVIAERTLETDVGIVIVNDTRVERGEYLEANIFTNASGSRQHPTRGAPCNTMRVYIEDDDVGEIGATGQDVVEGENIVLTVGHGQRRPCDVPFSYDVEVTPGGDTSALTSSAAQTKSFGPCEKSKTFTFPTRRIDGDAGNRKVTFTVQVTPGSGVPAGAIVAGAPTTVTVRDTTRAGIAVTSAAQPLATTETGGTATFTVALGSAPSADVTVALTSSEPGEGTPSPASLTFTASTWSTAQTVTVTGKDDSDADGTQAYRIGFGVTSADSNYNGRSVPSINLTNTDNENAPSVTVADAARVMEGEPLLFPLSVDMKGAANRPITVRWEVIPDEDMDVMNVEFDKNVEAEDLVAMTGEVTLASGVTSMNLPIATVDDEVYEDDDVVKVRLTSVLGATLGTTTTANGVLGSEDPLPVVSWLLDKPEIVEYPSIRLNAPGESLAWLHLKLDRPTQGTILFRMELDETILKR